MSKPKDIIIIPARMESARFPGKPMAMAGGKPLVRWVYDRAKQTKADHVVVATPDQEIARYCEDNGLLWMRTNTNHPTGTHRCAEVLGKFKRNVIVGTVINWQCDEPLVKPEDVDKLIDLSSIGCVTLVASFSLHEAYGPNTTKVAVSEDGRCLWFSRALMRGSCFHCGVYAYSSYVLKDLGKLNPTTLSKAESLEQLAWIEDGYPIHAVFTDKMPLSINTPEDFEKFKRIVENQNEDN